MLPPKLSVTVKYRYCGYINFEQNQYSRELYTEKKVQELKFSLKFCFIITHFYANYFLKLKNKQLQHESIFFLYICQPLDDTSEDFNTETWPCEYTKAIYEKIIGEDEDQLLEFEKHISKQEVSFFNPEMNISMFLSTLTFL